MTDAEKKLLQAKHRMEEAQARDRVKERKARTRRLIQEGAILEKACQRCGRWSCPTSKPISCRSGNDPVLYAGEPPGNRGLSFFVPEGRTYSPPRRGSGTCRWQAVRSPRGIAAAAAASRQCHSTYGRCCHRLCRRQIPCDKRRELGQKFSTLCCRLPAQTCHRQLCRRDGRAFCPSIFSFTKEKQKKETR